MNSADVMRMYNEYERKKIHALGGKKVISPEVTKFVADDVNGSYVSYFELNDTNADRVIQQEVDYFIDLGLNFEWKTYSSDLPLNIGERLIQRGFFAAESESFMVLDLESLDIKACENPNLVEVSDANGIRDAIQLQESVWDSDLSWQYTNLLNLKNHTPEDILIYVFYADGKPVTSGWIIFNGDSPFASIWGGSTLKEYRGKGYYSLLLQQRIFEAKNRGKKFLTIDASDMSKPIVEKQGFQFIAQTIGYQYNNF